MTAPGIAILPGFPPLEAAVVAAGGRIVPPEEADGIVWVSPGDPEGLAEALASSPARWVQLPFAGIERFVAAGVVDPSRTWTCTKGAYGHATAEQALALMLAAARLLHRHAVERRWWSQAESAGHRRLAGTTALIVGTGGIGVELARMLAPLHVRVLAANRSGRPMEAAERTVPSSGIAELAGDVDWLVLAAPLTAQTRHLANAPLLNAMRTDAWLVNVARGGLVDTGALVEALYAGTIGGAALDVTDPEPLPDGHPLWSFDNVIVTSHTANTFEMAVPELTALVERNVRRFRDGLPLEGLVDPALEY